MGVFMGWSLWVWKFRWRSAPLDQTEDKGQHGHDDENEKEDLGDANGPCGDAAKAKNGCDQRDDQKNHCEMQHVQLLGCASLCRQMGPRQECRAMAFTVGRGVRGGCRCGAPGLVGAAAGPP